MSFKTVVRFIQYCIVLHNTREWNNCVIKNNQIDRSRRLILQERKEDSLVSFSLFISLV